MAFISWVHHIAAAGLGHNVLRRVEDVSVPAVRGHHPEVSFLSPGLVPITATLGCFHRLAESLFAPQYLEVARVPRLLYNCAKAGIT